ncbi:hypothetical protein FQZ97_1188070 [compost metagenome]
MVGLNANAGNYLVSAVAEAAKHVCCLPAIFRLVEYPVVNDDHGVCADNDFLRVFIAKGFHFTAGEYFRYFFSRYIRIKAFIYRSRLYFKPESGIQKDLFSAG